jgi:hypothetical protein
MADARLAKLRTAAEMAAVNCMVMVLVWRREVIELGQWWYVCIGGDGGEA